MTEQASAAPDPSDMELQRPTELSQHPAFEWLGQFADDHIANLPVSSRRSTMLEVRQHFGQLQATINALTNEALRLRDQRDAARLAFAQQSESLANLEAKLESYRAQPAAG